MFPVELIIQKASLTKNQRCIVELLERKETLRNLSFSELCELRAAIKKEYDLIWTSDADKVIASIEANPARYAAIWLGESSRRRTPEEKVISTAAKIGLALLQETIRQNRKGSLR